MVSNELCLSCLIHAFDRVEGTGKLALESLASLNNLSHDLFSLHLRDTWAKWIIGQVATNSDACRLDHSSISFFKGWALELSMVHVADVASTLRMPVILLYDPIHEWSKSCVRVMRACIDTDTRVNILASGQDGGFEVESAAIVSVFKLIPNVLRQVLAEK